MTEPDQRPRASRLANRFAFILALALLPAGFISFLQTNALEVEVQARSEIALMGATVRSALAETGLIRRVRGMVGSLAGAVPFVLDDPQACNELMVRTATVEPTASLVAFIPASGVMTCSSTGTVYDFSANPGFRRVFDAKEPLFSVNPKGPVSGTSVLGISHPVFDLSGAYIGFASVSVPHTALDQLRLGAFENRNEIATPVVFWTFDRQGTVLTSNIDLAEVGAQLPSGRPMQGYVGEGEAVFQAMSQSGERLTYAVVPIVEDELYLMSSLLPEVTSFPANTGIWPYLPTLAMWLIGLFVAGFAAEYLVTRHVRALHRSILSFARGDRRLQAIEMQNPPLELSDLAGAYTSMTESIMHGEAELENSLHQKEVLLREVHHRVKNNLQLISSIMNIQIRSAQGGEAKELLKNLQERIMSLATVHRGLYQTSGLADVRARELIPDIVRQILSMSSGPEKPFETQNDIDDLRLVPDQAVPLSLMLAEALTNAIKHAGATREHPGRLTVRLKRSGGSDAVLEVANSHRKSEVAPGSGVQDSGIGSQLITAFVQQLGGRQESRETEDDYTLRVIFSVSPLSMAENRQAPASSDDQGWNVSAP